MRRTLLLFDIDGTLLLTDGAGMRAMAAAARRLFGEAFRWEGIAPGGSLDPLIFAEAAVLNGMGDAGDHHDRFREHYLEQLPVELAASGDRLRVMPGVPALLEALRRRRDERDDVVLGLLTGNYGRGATVKLEHVGIDPAWFTLTAFGDEAPTRPQLVAVAMRKYEAQTGEPADPRRVIVIGDTERDIDCARANGCVAFAVATGPTPIDSLRGARPDVLVPDLADPSPLLALLDGQ